jgi:hypothetical protein
MLLDDPRSEEQKQSNYEQRLAESKTHPTSYPAADFVAICQDAACRHLEKELLTLCLDPAQPVADGSPWYFPTLVSTLREYLRHWIAGRQPAAITTIGEKVGSALDYASETGKMVLIDGVARTGKTFSAKAWCAQRPGAARYVQVPATNDDFSFYRDIAKALGVSINLNSKANELRSRVEETLRDGRLMLVMDEAHYLWPQRFFGRSTPGRVNWLLTALVNYGVPVALIVTPQFFRSQKEIERRSCWTSEQFTGRIGHYQKLPDKLSDEELKAVTQSLLPKADSKSIGALVIYAKRSDKYLAAIEAVADRANYIAKQSGRPSASQDDIRSALSEDVIPSDSAFMAALEATEKTSRRRAISVPAIAQAEPLQSGFNRVEKPLQAPDLMRSRSVDRSASAELVH